MIRPCDPPPELLTARQLAKRLGVSVRTVWRWAGRGILGLRLPTVDVGGRRFIDLAEYRAWQKATAARRANADPAPFVSPAQRVVRAKQALAEL